MVVADIVQLQGIYELVGFLDDLHPERHGTRFCGLPVVGGQDRLDDLYLGGVQHIILGFGDCLARLRLSAIVQAKGFSLGTAIHPRATVAAGAAVGAGTVVAAGAVINPGVRIGENVIINTCASIDHGCLIEDCAHICPGAHLGGNVTVGQAAWVGIGSILRDRVCIGERAIIGAGSVVLKNIPDAVVAYGVPARVVRKVENGH